MPSMRCGTGQQDLLESRSEFITMPRSLHPLSTPRIRATSTPSPSRLQMLQQFTQRRRLSRLIWVLWMRIMFESPSMKQLPIRSLHQLLRSLASRSHLRRGVASQQLSSAPRHSCNTQSLIPTSLKPLCCDTCAHWQIAI